MPVSTSPPVGFAIDPRIRQRRIEVRRHQGRRRLRLLVALAGIVALANSIWLVLGSPVLDVDHIKVEGAGHTGRAAVLDGAGIKRGAAMIHVDEQHAARRLEALPWVDRAEVRRQWPGTVLVVVAERRPSAVTRTNAGGWALLDITGRVLDTVPERPEGLVELEGVLDDARPGSKTTAVAGPLAVVQSLSAPLAARTSAVVVVQGGEIDLRLSPRGTVRFGAPDQVQAKVRAIETVLASVDVANLSVLDVRLPASPVLTRG